MENYNTLYKERLKGSRRYQVSCIAVSETNLIADCLFLVRKTGQSMLCGYVAIHTHKGCGGPKFTCLIPECGTTGGLGTYDAVMDQMLRQGHTALKEYIEYKEECKQLGFDTIELDVASLGLPEETLLRYVRLIKSGGLRAKPQFSVKFNKSDIAFTGDRAFGAYMIPAPQTSEMVEDVDLLVRRAEMLEAGADMIMINADDLCRQADFLRSDIVAGVGTSWT
ncbi:Protein HEAT-STRESS-ASSOCIATED 32 [Datura stramonium]|uniref:Protein HEAT-STRESS-ASSOCIATED 32 n=1 Tax=Datura stramonium TaxID=4076 RepID=A0ABS8T7G2_DATST|nr:Protein HEAT-STRESS-ASSOCIATED 32 [Datura stramonium]